MLTAINTIDASTCVAMSMSANYNSDDNVAANGRAKVSERAKRMRACAVCT